MTKSNWTFIEHATDHLLKPRMGDQRHPTLWPSEATAIIKNKYDEDQVVGKCRRATYFRYLVHNYYFDDKYSFYSNLVEEIKTKELAPDRYMLWIWRAGELYEEYLIQLAKDSGVYINGQIPIYIKDFNISGKIDILGINPVTHKYTNIEAKSVYGFGGNQVLGTPGQRSKGNLGEPRDSNLMQIAIYDWWTASSDDAYEDSRLVYGSRDTGRYAEYLISTETNEENNIVEIFYTGAAPNQTNKVKSPITINSILEQYQYIQTSLDSGNIPERDYDLKYSEEKLALMYERDEITNKTDKERYEKRIAWEKGERKRETKPLIKGDWNCDRCKFKNICYKSTDIRSEKYGEPTVL